jgi:hypothetical protein
MDIRSGQPARAEQEVSELGVRSGMVLRLIKRRVPIGGFMVYGFMGLWFYGFIRVNFEFWEIFR